MIGATNLATQFKSEFDGWWRRRIEFAVCRRSPCISLRGANDSLQLVARKFFEWQC